MSKPAKLCAECGEPLTFGGTTRCMDCVIQAQRNAQRSWVPMFGAEVKRLPNVGTCERHKRRGCHICVGDNR